ncbi:MAG: oxidoreductase [Myxococcales bacterium]|nr:oxidoreductase [Myxococcales bacterium]
MRTTKFPNGDSVPVLGQGTWHMAEEPLRRRNEIMALRTGLDLGLTLIDTAEMYASGEAEVLVGEAITGRRDQVFLVDKVLPMHATKAGTIAACEASLRRLSTDRIDLYLLHWRSDASLEETIAGFEALISAGKIRSWGLSNFDVPDMRDVVNTPGGAECQTDQVLYNLARRGIEWDLLPWCRERAMPIMAYSPIEQGELAHRRVVERVAARHDAKPAQIALAWVLRQEGVIAIPKAGTPAHVRENCRALEIRLTKRDLAELDQSFPPPTRAQPLEII